ncbi:MAG: GNAT family N-acetyltransferase [Dehalococcoidia bacterium]
MFRACLVVEEGDALIGFAQFGQAPEHVSTDINDCELRRLYVTASRQGRGAGTSLLHAALEHPRAVKAPRIWLDVWVRNDGAQRLYRRHGFEVVGERKFEVASGAPTDVDLVMVRRRDGGGAS